MNPNEIPGRWPVQPRSGPAGIAPLELHQPWEAFDAINGGIYAARGDHLNAGLSSAACLPFVGSAATVGRFANKVDNVVDAAKTIRNDVPDYSRLMFTISIPGIF